ncbi:hypothetical protein DMUE_5718, partial [Dictyocoela muelleri]
MSYILNYKSKFFHDIEEAIIFLKGIDAIKESISCPKCCNDIYLKLFVKNGEKIFIYKCSKKTCRYTKNLMATSIFSNTKIKIDVLLFTIYCILGNVSNYFYESLVNISEKTFIRIKYN